MSKFVESGMQPIKCAVCGAAATIIDSDDIPRCSEHEHTGMPAKVAPLLAPVAACSACGSTASHHVAYVREHGVCVA